MKFRFYLYDIWNNNFDYQGVLTPNQVKEKLLAEGFTSFFAGVGSETRYIYRDWKCIEVVAKVERVEN